MGYISDMKKASRKGPRSYLLMAAKYLLDESGSGPVGAWEADAWCDLRNAVRMCIAKDKENKKRKRGK